MDREEKGSHYGPSARTHGLVYIRGVSTPQQAYCEVLSR